jgi:CheY-like chemotaxis protein
MQTDPETPVRRRVLLVEDDRSHRWVLRRLLEESLGEDVLIEEAESGQTALTLALRRPAVDLMLLDLHLPDMSGFEVLKKLRAQERTRSVPVIVLTSSQEKEDIRRAYECGANSFISKSETPESMYRRLQMLPVYWLELNRPPES